MFISEFDLKKHLLWNIIATAFLAIFGAIYEAFSHEVYSYYMIYAFAIPLILGVLPYTLLLLAKKAPGRVGIDLWNAGIAALSVGSIFHGVLDIYGTTNSLMIVYPIVGAVLLASGLFAAFKSPKKKEVSSPKSENHGLLVRFFRHHHKQKSRNC